MIWEYGQHGACQRRVIEHEGLRYQADEDNRAVVGQQVHVLVVAAQGLIESKT
jgi:hypothetical protein